MREARDHTLFWIIADWNPERVESARRLWVWDAVTAIEVYCRKVAAQKQR